MSNRTPIIFDTDIGVDDAFALMLAAGSPSIKLLGITTVFGNASLDTCSRNALQMCEFMGLDVPVAAGARKALVLPENDYDGFPHVHGADGLGNCSCLLPTPTKQLEDMSAVELIAKLVSESDEKVVLVPVGPLTNIAIFLMTYPELHDRIEGIAIMGGAAYGGNFSVVGEANIAQDPEAAQIVFQSGIKIMMAGLDVTEQAFFTPEDIQTLASVNGKVSDFYVKMIGNYGMPAAEGRPRRNPCMHDSVPVAWLINPNLIETEPANVRVDLSGEHTRSCTATDFMLREKPNALVALEIDREAFVELHKKALENLG